MRSTLIIILFLYTLNSGRTQNIDSLEFVADTILNYEQKSHLFWELTQHYDSAGRHTDAINAAKESLRISKSINDQTLMTQAYLKLAKLYHFRNAPDEAITYLKLYSLMDKALQEEAYRKEITGIISRYNNEKTQLNEDIHELEGLVNENLKELSRLRNIVGYQKTFLITALVVFVVFIVVSGYFQFNTGKKYREAVSKHTSYTEHLESEVGEVSNELNSVRNKLKAYESERAKQLSLARRVQKELLGEIKVFRKSFPKSVIFNQPRDVTAGDFMWYGNNREKHIIMVCDTGSTPLIGTYLSLIINAFLSHLVYEQNITAPNMLLTLLDQQLKQKLELENENGFYGLKASIAVFNKDKTELDIASAVLPVYIFHKNELEQITPTRQPLGSTLFKEKFYDVNKFELSRNDTLYMLTDGFEDQLGGNEYKKFKRPALRNLLASIETQKVKDQEYVIQKVFKDWKGRNPQTDDVLIVGISI